MNSKIDIQILRGISVLSVVFFHIFPQANNGYLGVDIFFVISGYLLTPKIIFILENKKQKNRISELRFFYTKRLYRLTPALSTSILFFVIIIFISSDTEEHGRIIKQCLATIFLLGNLGAYKFNGNYFNPNPNPFTHTWSLSLEEQIYLILPLLLLLLLFVLPKISIKTSYKILCSISFIFFIIPSLTVKLLSLINVTDYFSNFYYYSTVNRFWEFGIGGICGLMVRNSYKPGNFFKITINIFVLLVLVWGVYSEMVNTVLIVSLACVAIMTESFSYIPKYFRIVLNFIGNKSYSIYLVHFPIIYIVKYSFIFDINNVFKESVIILALVFLIGLTLNKNIENKYRYTYLTTTLDYFSLRKIVICFIILPVLFLTSLLHISQKNYFGLIKKSERPIAAWDIDKNCSNNILINPCVYQAKDSKGMILLIGDSHAAQVSQTIKNVALKSKYNLAVWPYCDFQITDYGKMQDPKCIEHNKKILSWITVNKPEIVIISQRMHAKTSYQDINIAITKLKNFTSRIILIGNNPVYADSTKFFKDTLLFKYTPKKFVDLNEMDQDSLIAGDKFKKLAFNLGISYIDTKEIFCNSISCKRFENGNWLYWDAGHLSIYGSDLLAKYIESAIKVIK
jgi:peptidoglycan/LPS O-acetylase OafA/YrhL